MNWPKGPYSWIEDRTLFVSVPFTWDLPTVHHQISQRDYRYDRVAVGGPAVDIMPLFLANIPDVEIGGELPGVLQKVNHLATRTTLGCPNHCEFCAIGQRYIEGPCFRELTDWPDRSVICDNNLLAASRRHFRRVINRLKKHPFADFNQGLDASLLDWQHVDLLTELKKPIIRIAWDTIGQESKVMRAIGLLKSGGIPKSRIRCYVMIGYKDTPDEALYRLETLDKMGIYTNPMRYTPLKALSRSEYVNTEKGWTQDTLLDYMKFWTNKRYFAGIPFKDFQRKQRGPSDPTLPLLFGSVPSVPPW